MFNSHKTHHLQQLAIHYHHHRCKLFPLLLLISLYPSITAFIPFFGSQLHLASAMATDNSCTTNHPIHPASSVRAENPSVEDDSAHKSANDDLNSEPLLLPASDIDDPSIPKIRLGDTIAFEQMGPVIINPDGTTRRIDNWDKMTKKEQEVAWRRISKRNAERRAALMEKQLENEE